MWWDILKDEPDWPEINRKLMQQVERSGEHTSVLKHSTRLLPIKPRGFYYKEYNNKLIFSNLTVEEFINSNRHIFKFTIHEAYFLKEMMERGLNARELSKYRRKMLYLLEDALDYLKEFKLDSYSPERGKELIINLMKHSEPIEKDNATNNEIWEYKNIIWTISIVDKGWPHQRKGSKYKFWIKLEEGKTYISQYEDIIAMSVLLGGEE